MILLAQSAPDAAALKSFLEVFFYLAGSATALLVGWKKLKEKPAAELPSPLVVKGHVDFATREELRQAHGRMNREKAESDARFARIEADATAAAEHLDTVVEGLRDQLASNNTAGEARVVALHNRINAIPGEIINLLRSTKGLLE